MKSGQILLGVVLLLISGCTSASEMVIGSDVARAAEFVNSEVNVADGIHIGRGEAEIEGGHFVRYVVVLRVTGNTGYLFEITQVDQKWVTSNVAELVVDNNSAIVIEAMGGLATYERLRQAATTVMRNGLSRQSTLSIEDFMSND